MPYVLKMWHHAPLVAHHRLKLDPADPAKTDVRYCLYDRPWRKHVYTQAWVRKLIEDYGIPEQLAAVVGKARPEGERAVARETVARRHRPACGACDRQRP
ncbi:MAG: hypothetical protein M3Q27_01345 [Actinomycetota bacterium]|nr:hypothetical protein [Actinomycetota bacterium]